MATYYRTQGIILSSEDQGEADRIFCVFTEHFGKVRLRAVSERKITSKLRGGLRGCSLVNLDFIQGRNGKTATEADVSHHYSNITKDLERTRAAFSIFRAADMFIRGEEQEQAVWNLLLKSLEALNQEDLSSKTLSLLPYYFLWNMISLAGYRPHLESCVSCQRKADREDVWFQVDEGGIQCIRCADIKTRGAKVSLKTLELMRRILEADISLLSEPTLSVIETRYFRQVSKDYVTRVLERIS